MQKPLFSLDIGLQSRHCKEESYTGSLYLSEYSNSSFIPLICFQKNATCFCLSTQKSILDDIKNPKVQFGGTKNPIKIIFGLLGVYCKGRATFYTALSPKSQQKYDFPNFGYPSVFRFFPDGRSPQKAIVIRTGNSLFSWHNPSMNIL